MRQLMISLDKKILDPTSAAAARMIAYGKKYELFIIIPNRQKIQLDLSPTVHVYGSGGFTKPGQFGSLYDTGKKILKKEPVDLITTQDPFFIGLIGYWLSRQFKLPVTVQLHGDFFGSNYYRTGSLPNWLRYQIAKYLVKRADKIRAVGERVKQSVLALGVSENKIEVRAVPVDTEKIRTYQPKFNVHERYPGYEKIFLVLGRLDAVKNISWLLQIWATVVPQQKKYLLLIVGEGRERRDLEYKIKILGLQNNVKLAGWTNDSWSYLKTVDCVLFPSLSEGYGLVSMEASAVGTQLIMSDVGVANFELKASPKVVILPVNDQWAWTQQILKS